MINPKHLFYLFALLLVSCKSEPVKQKEILYVGTSSSRGSQGIYVFEFNRDSLIFSLKQTLPELINPNFLEIHPSGKTLYSVNVGTDAEGNRVDLVSSFSIDQENGTLELLNQVPAHGTGACHVHLDKTGKYVYISFYRSGSLAVFNVHPDGSIGDSIQTITYEGSSFNKPRQDAPHVHSALVSSDNQYVYIADLGTDKIMIHSIDHQTGKLNPASMPWASSPPGAGPRHLTFHPDKPYLYLAEELSSSTSLFYQDHSSGSLTLIQTIPTLPENFNEPNSVADIHAHPEGKFLYVSNRGHNSLVIYSINSKDGKLTVVGHQSTLGGHPRNFHIEPEGDLLLAANRDTDNIAVFRRDKATGLLNYTEVLLNVPAPVCLKWLKL